MTTKAISTTQLLATIHKAALRLRSSPDPDLQRLTDTAVSVMALHIRNPTAFVNEDQNAAITRLREYVESTNIHT